MRKKPKLSKKQEKTIAKMKEVRQIDSSQLRTVILAKQKWTIAELKRAKQQMLELKVNMNRLEGILLFIKDLIDPKEEEK